jgi:hypothetical protein
MTVLETLREIAFQVCSGGNETLPLCMEHHCCGVGVDIRDRESRVLISSGESWQLDRPCIDISDLCFTAIRGAFRQRNPPWATIELSGITFDLVVYSRLRQARVQDLNSNSLGLVVRSRTDPARSGSCLPCGPHFELRQFTNASICGGLTANETCDLLVFDTQRFTERPPMVLDQQRLSEVGDQLTQLARSYLSTHRPSESMSASVLSGVNCSAIAVALGASGVLGCGTAWQGSIEDRVLDACELAMNDERFLEAQINGLKTEEITVVVSLLYNPEVLDARTPVEAADGFRPGLDSISVQQQDRFAVYLESVIPETGWSTVAACQSLLSKARIYDPPYIWTRYETTSWSQQSGAVRQLQFGLPVVRESASFDVLIDRVANYIQVQTGTRAVPAYHLSLSSGEVIETGSLTRSLFALGALGEAAKLYGRREWGETFRRGYEQCYLGLRFGPEPGVVLQGRSEDRVASLDLLAFASLAEAGNGDPGLRQVADYWLTWFQPDGSVAAPGAEILQSQQVLLPGFIIYALAKYFLHEKVKAIPFNVEKSIEFYRDLFRRTQRWEITGWHPHAWSCVYEVSRCPDVLDFVFELADWVIERQLSDGSFLTTLATFPSFHTAYFAESIGSAWEVAGRMQMWTRYRKYGNAWRCALDFMRHLIVEPGDLFAMRAGESAIGAVRLDLCSFESRIDFAGHALNALLKKQAVNLVLEG